MAGLRALLTRISRLEVAAAVVVGVVLLVLVVIEPDILQAPVENINTVVFTVGGTVLAAIALVLMLRWEVRPGVRLAVLGIPFLIVNWWLLSPFFINQVADDDFDTTIAAAQAATDDPVVAPSTTAAADGAAPAPTEAPTPSGPVLLAAGSFKGLAGHDGSGDAGLFRLADGKQVLRFENFDIDNGPDLRLYVVPGADAVDLADGSLYLGRLKGNKGDQTYDIPDDRHLASGEWTVLVWCEAFDVEFVGANLTV